MRMCARFCARRSRGARSHSARVRYSSGMDDVFSRLRVTEDQISEFCRKWSITRFELFGSVLRDDFDAESDIDVLVTFDPQRIIRLNDLLDMEDELQALFGRKVDLIKRHLVEESPNWIRRRSILGSAREVYAAAS